MTDLDPKDLALVKSAVKTAEDFPIKGVLFYDLLPVFADSEATRALKRCLTKIASEYEFDKIGAIDARGFIYGIMIADLLGKDAIFFRKGGKLPPPTVKEEYALEYGTSTIEMSTDSVKKGERILIVDDVLATGNTAKSAAKIVEKMGGEVAGMVFILGLSALKGRELLSKYDVSTLFDA